jgi:predicted dehydrogenase
MSELRKVAIIGVGRAGLQHARAALALGLEVSAYSSLSEHSTRAQAFARQFPQARRLELESSELGVSADLVVVALPPEVTHEVVLSLVKNSRNLLVEKPLALSTSRIKQIAEAAAASGCKVTVGYNRRVYPAVQRVRQALLSDPARTAEVTIVEDIDFIKRTKGLMAKDGYLRHGASAHMLDLVQSLFGLHEPAMVRASLSNVAEGFVDYEFESVGTTGVRVKATIDAGDRSRRGIQIVTSSGRVLLLAPLERLHIGDATFDYPESYTESFVDQMRCIIENRVEDLHGIGDSMRLSKLVDALEVASKELRHEW